jgi:hypothetical protein
MIHNSMEIIGNLKNIHVELTDLTWYMCRLKEQILSALALFIGDIELLAV